MGIKEEIFESFLNKLETDTQFPDSAVEPLRNLLEGREAISQQGLLNVIERTLQNDGQNQED